MNANLAVPIHFLLLKFELLSDLTFTEAFSAIFLIILPVSNFNDPFTLHDNDKLGRLEMFFFVSVLAALLSGNYFTINHYIHTVLYAISFNNFMAFMYLNNINKIPPPTVVDFTILFMNHNEK